MSFDPTCLPANLRSFRLYIGYHGAHFYGSQQQPEGHRTVEGEIRSAVSRLNGGADYRYYAASRTDAGVHALRQCILLQWPTSLNASTVARALQSLTPEDIDIVECEEVDHDFHPRFHALEKRYIYRFSTAPRLPIFGAQTQWHVREQLDVEAMQEAGQCFVGEHDFEGFRNKSVDEPEDTKRVIRALRVSQDEDHRVFFQVIGKGFLYKMVRNMVGTLYYVGRGRMSKSDVLEVLKSRNRELAGPTAPAQGLFLADITYAGMPPCELQGRAPHF